MAMLTFGRTWRCCPGGLYGCCPAKLKKLPVTKKLIKIYVATFLAMFSSAYAVTMVFPFLPFMVQFLLPEVDEASIGRYAGIIASSLFFGWIFGSYVWGAIADIKGRKPVLIASGILMGLTSAAFGFSVNFTMAVILRFGVGLFNGLLGTSKAILGEASDNTNQAFGASLVGAAFAMGLIVGPAVSGAVADPIGQYNLSISNQAIHDFLTRFPYSLPCLVNLLICIIAVMVVICWLPETLGMKTNKVKGEEDLVRESDVSSNLRGEESSRPSPNLEPPTDSLPYEDSACGDVDLGTVGKRPFATRSDDGDTCISPKATLECGSDSGTLLAAANDSGVSLQRNGSSSPLCSDSSSVDGGTVGLIVSDDDLRTLPRDGQVEGDDVDLGELLTHSSSVSEARTGKDWTPPPKQKTFRKQRRRSSFLIPFFNRRDSISISFIKPSLSALRRKYEKQQSAESQEVGGDDGSETGSQEGIDILQDDDRVELLGGSVVKPFWLKRWLKNAGKLVKKALLDVKFFLCNRDSLLAVLIYCTFAFGVIGFDEVYSLWAATNPSLGGLGWALHEIGISLAVVGVIFLPFSLPLFPALERRFETIKSFYISSIPLVFLMVLLPNIHLLVSSGQTVLLWILVCAVAAVIRINISVCFSSCGLFINNSVTFDKLGAINGFAISMNAVFRCVAPIFSGGLYSVSLSEGARSFGFPVDYHLIFIVFGLIFLIVIMMVACLPKSINRQKVVEGQLD